jgi:uncharacterized membrane protein
MKLAKAAYQVSIISGILIIIAGIIMYFNNEYSQSYITFRFGGYGTGFITPIAAICIGSFLLLLSWFLYSSYKKEKKHYAKLSSKK